MSEEISTPNAYSAMTPVETWIKALTKPNELAYREIVNDPGASLGKAILWVAGFGFVGGLLSGIFRAIFNTSMAEQFGTISEMFTGTDMPLDMPIRAGGGFLSVIGSSFGGAVGGVIGALLFVGLIHLVSRALGGTGSFEKLFYGSAAYSAPLGMVTSVLGAIPFISCLGLPLGIYGIVLAVMANKATHEYDTGKAVIATLAPVLVIFLLCCCVVAVFGTAFSALLGPEVQDIFGNLQY